MLFALLNHCGKIRTDVEAQGIVFLMLKAKNKEDLL
jgi:hypothetical protein